MDEQVSMEQQQQHLPPQLQVFLDQLRGDRRSLLKDASFKDPTQLRQFVGQFIMPRIEEMFRVLAGMTLEAYGLAASNTTELRRLHSFTVARLNDMGAQLDDVDPPGVSPDTLNAFHEAFYTLGTLLNERCSGDTEIMEAFSACEKEVTIMVQELMSGMDYDDYDDDRDDDDRDDDDDRSEEDTEPPDEPEAPDESESTEEVKPEPTDG